MSRRTVIYLACPMRSGSWTNNVRTACQVAKDLMRKGYSVINPITSWLADLVEPTEFKNWIEMDYGLIDVSDCVLRVPGTSEGADLEMDYAARNDTPFFSDISELYSEMPNRQVSL